MSKDLQLLFKDVPLHQLLEKDITQMSEDELRAYTTVMQQRTSVPGAKRSAKAKQSKITSGKLTPISLKGFTDE